MTKNEFLARLRQRLAGLPQKEVEERLGFYCEMIDDRIDEGLSEGDAVCALGSTDEITTEIVSDIPLAKIVKEKIKPKRALRVWEILLIALGSPIWLSLLITAFAVTLSGVAVMFSIVVSLWAVFGTSVCCAVGFVAAGGIFAAFENALTGIATVGTGIFLAGVAIFLFFGCKAATVGVLHLIKVLIFSIKKCFVEKEKAQ